MRLLLLLCGVATFGGGLGCGPDGGDGSGPGGKADNPDDVRACGYQAPMATGQVDFGAAEELSGLVASRQHPSVLWTHNDGDEPVIFAMSRAGELLREIELADSPAHDWEDLSMGPGPIAGRDYLYIADTGDNDLERKRIQIIRVLEPDPFDAAGAIEPVEVFELEYDDGDAHDAEAMFVDPTDGRVYVVTKRTDHDDRKSKLFASVDPLPEGGGRVELVRLVTEKKAPHLDGVWVAADISPAGDEIALVRDKGANLIFSRAPGEPIEEALAGEPCSAPRSKGHQESIAYSAGGGGFYMVPEGKRPVLTFAAAEPSCPEVVTSRELIAEAPSAVEVSGVVASPTSSEVFWVVNDPGPGQRDVVVAIDRRGIERGAVRLLGAINEDWEDIAVDGQGRLYVGDIGDNDEERESVTVYRLDEPALASLSPGRLDAVDTEAIELVYADGEARDAESLIVDPESGDLYVLSRRRGNEKATAMFVARAPLSTTVLNLLEPVSERGLGTATSADLGRDGERLVVRLREGGNLIAARHPDQEISELIGAGCRVPGGSSRHDSVAIDGDGLLIISEDQPAEMLFVELR